MPYNGYRGMNGSPRDQITQTMMNISAPPPQAIGGLRAPSFAAPPMRPAGPMPQPPAPPQQPAVMPPMAPQVMPGQAPQAQQPVPSGIAAPGVPIQQAYGPGIAPPPTMPLRQPY